MNRRHESLSTEASRDSSSSGRIFLLHSASFLLMSAFSPSWRSSSSNARYPAAQCSDWLIPSFSLMFSALITVEIFGKTWFAASNASRAPAAEPALFALCPSTTWLSCICFASSHILAGCPDRPAAAESIELIRSERRADSSFIFLAMRFFTTSSPRRSSDSGTEGSLRSSSSCCVIYSTSVSRVATQSGMASMYLESLSTASSAECMPAA
mmetsp:Transcript_31697/g.52422  ORF Transcript_31697/g.52422 Transcript_31697/m.52422 type:complete len:211 (+) Transcript_31697:1693-2325(+)